MTHDRDSGNPRAARGLRLHLLGSRRAGGHGTYPVNHDRFINAVPLLRSPVTSPACPQCRRPRLSRVTLVHASVSWLCLEVRGASRWRARRAEPLQLEQHLEVLLQAALLLPCAAAAASAQPSAPVSRAFMGVVSCWMW